MYHNVSNLSLEHGKNLQRSQSKIMKIKLLALTAALAALLRFRPRNVQLANIAEGTHLSSMGISFLADQAITSRFLLAKIGAASNSIDICGATDLPIGVIDDEVAAADIATQQINIRPLNSDRTLLMQASAAITRGALLEPAAAGQVKTLTTTTGTHYCVGIALNAATNAGDLVEVMPSFQKIVSP
jgi:hypothetical protein